jgi:hypothetical protein
MHWGEGRILNYPPPDVNIDVRARRQSPQPSQSFLWQTIHKVQPTI